MAWYNFWQPTSSNGIEQVRVGRDDRTASGFPMPAGGGILGWLRNQRVPWPGTRYATDTKSERELEAEKAKAGPPTITHFPWFLPYSDDFTIETREMRLAYRRMFAMSEVKAAVLSKIFGVGSLDLTLHPADKKDTRDQDIAEFIQWNLTKRLYGGMANLCWSLLVGGLIDGYAILEKKWVQQKRGKYAGKFVLRELKPKDVDNDVILQTDEFRNITGVLGVRYNAGVWFDPGLFVIWQYLPMYGKPVGQSDLRAAYSAYWRLDTCRKLRAMGGEKRALPVIVGKWKNAAHKTALETALASVKSTNWMSIPDDVQAEVLEISGKADEYFANWERDTKQEIFTGINLAVLQQMEGGTPDGRGDSQVHKDTADLAKWFLKEQVCTVLNDEDCGIIADMVALNYVAAELPSATMGGVDDAELGETLKIDQGLHAMGVDLSKEQLAEIYNRKPPVDDADRLPGQSAAAPPAPGGGLPFEERNGTGAEVPARPFPRPAGATDSPTKQRDKTEYQASAARVTTDKAAHSGEVALAGHDGRQAAELLKKAKIEGAAVLADLTRKALRRHLKGGADSLLSVGKLFNDAETADLADMLAATTGTAKLLGRARIRLRQEQAAKFYERFAEKFCGGTGGKPGPCPEGDHAGTAKTLKAAHPYPEIPKEPAPAGMFNPKMVAASPALQAALHEHEQRAAAFQRARVADLTHRMLAETHENPVAMPKPGDSDERRRRLAATAINRVAGASADLTSLADPAFAKHHAAVARSHPQGQAALHAARAEAKRRYDANLKTAEEHIVALPASLKPRAEKALAQAKHEAEAHAERFAETQAIEIMTQPPKRLFFSEQPTDFSRFDEPDRPGIKPFAPEKAATYFKSLVPRLNVQPERYGQQMRREAFTLAAATDETLLDRIKRLIQQRIETGEKVSDAPREIDKLLDDAGVSPRNPQYAEMAVRTNMMDAYNTGADEERQDPDVIEDFPVWRYLGIRDGRQGKDHEPKFDNFYPASASFAEVRGPRVYNCRCTSQPVYKEDWKRLQAGGASVSTFAEERSAPSCSAGLIPVPDIRQHDHFSCGASAAMCVGLHFGVGSDDLEEWKRALGTSLARSTHPHAIRDYLRLLGLSVEDRQGMTIDDLYRHTAAGRPVIVCVQDYGDRREPGASFAYGHYLTVIGVGAGQVMCQDSSRDNVLIHADLDTDVPEELLAMTRDFLSEENGEPKADDLQAYLDLRGKDEWSGTQLKAALAVVKKELADEQGTIEAPGRIMVPQDKFLDVWHDQDEQGNKFICYGIAVGRRK